MFTSVFLLRCSSFDFCESLMKMSMLNSGEDGAEILCLQRWSCYLCKTEWVFHLADFFHPIHIFIFSYSGSSLFVTFCVSGRKIKSWLDAYVISYDQRLFLLAALHIHQNQRTPYSFGIMRTLKEQCLVCEKLLEQYFHCFNLEDTFTYAYYFVSCRENAICINTLF